MFLHQDLCVYREVIGWVHLVLQYLFILTLFFQSKGLPYSRGTGCRGILVLFPCVIMAVGAPDSNPGPSEFHFHQLRFPTLLGHRHAMHWPKERCYTECPWPNRGRVRQAELSLQTQVGGTYLMQIPRGLMLFLHLGSMLTSWDIM